MTDKTIQTPFFNLFLSDTVVYKTSTREFGKIKNGNHFIEPSFNSVLKSLGIPRNNVVRMNQTHSPHVWMVDKNIDSSFSDTDGLLTSEKNIFLCAVTADCLPIFILDKKKRICGILHAGYKGLLNGVIQEALLKIKKHDISLEDILIGIGPSIRTCCYDVPYERVELFKKTYPFFSSEWYEEKDKKVFLNLQKIATDICTHEGISVSHIEDCRICTKCHNDQFYSYRGDTKETFGQNLSIIGLL